MLGVWKLSDITEYNDDIIKTESDLIHFGVGGYMLYDATCCSLKYNNAYYNAGYLSTYLHHHQKGTNACSTLYMP